MTQKYSDNLEQGVEMAATSESDDETNDTAELMGGGQKQVEKHRCLKRACKIVLALAATSMFVVMLVQLWTNYGDYIENRVFSPTVVGAGTFSREGAVDTYLMAFHKWESDTLHVTMKVPDNPLVQVDGVYEWGEECLMVNSTKPNVTVVVWSLWSD